MLAGLGPHFENRYVDFGLRFLFLETESILRLRWRKTDPQVCTETHAISHLSQPYDLELCASQILWGKGGQGLEVKRATPRGGIAAECESEAKMLHPSLVTLSNSSLPCRICFSVHKVV